MKIKVASKITGIRVHSTKPGFRYDFGYAGEPIEMPESHAKKITKNPDFYLTNKPIKKGKKSILKGPKREKPWSQELEDIKGIGEKISKDIIAVYPTKSSLLEAIANKAHIPFPDNAVELLKKEFIH